MAMIVLSSPVTLTEPEEKKTGPSRFRRYFSGGWVDTNFTDWHGFRCRKLGAGTGNRMNGFRGAYRKFTADLQPVYTRNRGLPTSLTQNIRTDQIKQVRLHRVYSDNFAYRPQARNQAGTPEIPGGGPERPASRIHATTEEGD
jgi:hypothetical protein